MLLERIKMENAETLLKMVVDYYEGNDEYDFSKLEDYDRNNQSFDSWQLIMNKIKEYLSVKIT